jgi:hypothetical protein
MVKLAMLLFGAGVAWGTVKIDARTVQDRQTADHAIIENHEIRLDQIEQCMSGMEATQLAMLEQLRQMNENVQSINEFLRQAVVQ